MNDYVEAMKGFRTERPITHILTIPVGMEDPQASKSDVLLLLNRAIGGIMMAACQTNLVPAYVGQPTAVPVGEVSEAETELGQIDNLLARRPALPGRSRLDDIAFMLAVLREADPSGEIGKAVEKRNRDRLATLPAPEAR